MDINKICLKHIKLIDSLLENGLVKFQSVQNKALVWDCIQCEIKGPIIQFVVKKSKENRRYERNLRAELKIKENKKCL